MHNGLLLWFFFAMFTRWGKISLPSLPDISPERLIWVLLVLFLIAETTIERKRKMLPFTGIEIAMLLFVVYIVMSMINAGTLYSSKEGLMVRSLLTGYLMPFSIFFLAKYIIDSEQKIKKTYIFFSVIGFYLGFTAICEYFNLNYLIWPSYIKERWSGSHWGRARGPFLQGAINGYVQGIFILMTSYLLLHLNNKKLKIFFSVSIAVMLCGLLFSFSRTSWAGFILSSLIMPIFFPQTRKVYLTCFLAAVIIIGVRYNVDYRKNTEKQTWNQLVKEGSLEDKIAARTMTLDSIYGRITMYGVVWRIFLDKPLFGLGYNTFQGKSSIYFGIVEGIPMTVHEGTNVHDTFSGILAELGIVGLGFFLFILVQILMSSVKLYRRLPTGGFSGKGIVVIFFGIFIAFFINMQFRQMRLFMFPSSLFFLMAGIICGLNQRISLGNIVDSENNNRSQYHWKI